MDLLTSNALHIPGIGIVTVVNMAYLFSYVQRKMNKKRIYVHIVDGVKGALRNIFGRINFFTRQLKNKKSNQTSNATNHSLESSNSLHKAYSPSRYHDLSFDLESHSPSHDKRESGASVRSNPKSPSYHTNLGNLKFERRKYDKAAWHYKQALQIDGLFDPAHTGMGHIEYTHGKIYSAMRHYTFAVKMNNNNHEALVGLGNCFQKIGQYEKALECYEKAYKLDTRNKDLNGQLSNLYLAGNEYDKAEAILTRSIALYPDCSRFYKRIGDLYWTLNKEKKAIDAYTCFINLKCDKRALANLVRSKFERYLALEIISDLIKGKKKINYDAFIKEMSRMMTIFLIRQGILGEPNNAKQKAYQGFSNYFIDKVLLRIAKQQGHQLHEDAEFNISTEFQLHLNSEP